LGGRPEGTASGDYTGGNNSNSYASAPAAPKVNTGVPSGNDVNEPVDDLPF
jgi:hypothetical protein